MTTGKIVAYGGGDVWALWAAFIPS